jgi:hypothetical protein
VAEGYFIPQRRPRGELVTYISVYLTRMYTAHRLAANSTQLAGMPCRVRPNPLVNYCLQGIHASAVRLRWMVVGAVDIESPLFPGSFLSIFALIFFLVCPKNNLNTPVVLPQ